MRMPGFSAHHALGPIQANRGVPLTSPTTGVSPALGISWGTLNAGLFWACFRNCYAHCGESEPGNCFGPCYDICNWNPTVVFLR